MQVSLKFDTTRLFTYYETAMINCWKWQRQ